jgi:hypothetical protein
VRRFLAIVLVISTLFLSTFFVHQSAAFTLNITAAGPTDSTTETTNYCSAEISQQVNLINVPSARSFAQSSSFYALNAVEYNNISYYSIFEIDNYTTACTVSVSSVNVVFALNNSSGFVGYLVISENPSSLFPIGWQLQEGSTVHSSTNNNPIWGGYEIYGNAQASAFVSGVVTNFNQASLTTPPTGCADHNTCYMSEWVGLEDEEGGVDNNLVQDGTDACIGSECVNGNNAAWFELYPLGSVYCSGMNIHPGDNIFSRVLNEGFDGGSKSSYDFLIEDTTRNTACGANAQPYSQMQDPHYAAYIIENPPIGCTTQCPSLPKFAQITFSLALYYVGSSNTYYPIADATSNGWDYKDVMVNCGTTNVLPGTVSSESFPDSWKSSANTPFWNSGC